MNSRHLLLCGGLALALVGMSYGLWYAVFAEHQALDGMGRSLTVGFQAAAEKNSAAREQALLAYRQAKYAYDRQVDVHGHWIGLAMLLLVLAMGQDRIGFSPKWKLLLAWILVLGSGLFPLGVLLETWSEGSFPRALAILGSAMLTIALAGMAAGFLRRENS